MAGTSAISSRAIKCSYDAAVIGCGFVGAAIARALAIAGLEVLVIEPSAPFSGASGNNSGIICTGFDAAEHSLERRALRGGRAELLALARRSLPAHAFRPSGSLIADFGTPSISPFGPPVLGPAEAAAALDEIVEECLAVDDFGARCLTASEVRILEPLIASDLRSAALIPGEIVFDPFLLGVAILRSATRAGAQLLCGHAVLGAKSPSCSRDAAARRARVAAPVLEAVGLEWASGFRPGPAENAAGNEPVLSPAESSDLWELSLGPAGEAADRGGLGPASPTSADAASCSTVLASLVFNCAGNFGDIVQASRSPADAREPPPRVRPRRGQYVVTAPLRPLEAAARDVHLQSPLQPLPTASTKGVYAFAPAMASPEHAALVVGPTATDVPCATPSDSALSADFGVRERRFAELSPDVEQDLLAYSGQRLPSCSALPAGTGAAPRPAAPAADSSISTPGRAGAGAGWGVLGRYGGLRPAAEGRRDYAIAHEGGGWWSVLGVRSTGASASLGIGRMVAASALAEAVTAVRGAAAAADEVAAWYGQKLTECGGLAVDRCATGGGGARLRQLGLELTAVRPNPSPKTDPALFALQSASSAAAWRRNGRLALESVFWSRQQHAAAAPAADSGWPTVDLGDGRVGRGLALRSPGYDTSVSCRNSSCLAVLAEIVETAGLAASEAAELSRVQRPALTSPQQQPASAVPSPAPSAPTLPGSALRTPQPSSASALPEMPAQCNPDTILDSDSLIRQFCSSLQQDLDEKGLDRSVLRRPSHMWPVTGHVEVDALRLPVTHSLTKLLWAYQGGLLEPLPAGTDVGIAFDRQ